jgi:hypothetical protein
MANPGEVWSETEVSETVADYLAMLRAEAAGQAYSKAEHRRALQEKLTVSRTPQAIEFKHANISAAMIELGLPYIRGYRPRGNYQAELATEIRRRVADPQLLAALRAQPGTPPRGTLLPAEPPPPPAAAEETWWQAPRLRAASGGKPQARRSRRAAGGDIRAATPHPGRAQRPGPPGAVGSAR